MPLAAIMAQRKPRSRAAYVLLGMLLGWCGVHNLYAGRYLRAALQAGIAIFGFAAVFPVIFVAIWAFVEIGTVQRDGNGLLMKF